MTTAPTDLVAFRHVVKAKTGIQLDASIGIVGDGAHQRTGGYHEGRDVLIMIGKYHPSYPAGDSREDFSARLARDRAGLTLDASAMDIGCEWRAGGRSAWLRFNRLLVAQLRAGDPALGPIAEVNYTPDGARKVRIQRKNGWAEEATSDTVDVHTHIGWHRDTAGRRQACLDRLAEFIDAAIANRTPPVLEGASMAGSGITMSWGETLDAYLHRIEQLWVPATAAATALPAKLEALTAVVTTQGQTITALTGLLQQAGGNPELTPLVEQLQALAAELGEVKAREAEQTALIQQLQQAARAGASAEAAALQL